MGRGERGTKTAAAAVLVALLSVFALTAAAAAAPKHRSKRPTVVIRRSAYGIPHIIGRNWEDVGFGYGYAFAQDDICPMAEDYVTVRAQRARWFGPNGTYAQRGNGTTPDNLNRDFFYHGATGRHIVSKPRGPTPPKVADP